MVNSGGLAVQKKKSLLSASNTSDITGGVAHAASSVSQSNENLDKAIEKLKGEKKLLLKEAKIVELRLLDYFLR